ncbi:MAG: MFS transporter [bacterium]
MTIIFLFGLISLLGDIIYEGGRSVNGQYLNTLGANATIVGFVVGIGELAGYIIRLFSGYICDKKKAHWLFVICGYSLLVSVPLLSISSYWQSALIFIVLERIGKGLRSPARDTLLSYATKRVGRGFGFGIAEFLDNIGAVVGPLIFTFFFIAGPSLKTISDYQNGYSLFWLPFTLLIIVLFIAYFKVRNPEELEKVSKNEPSNLTRIFWLYSFFTFITTIGFVSFAIIGYHLKVNKILSDAQIPVFYCLAMAIDAMFGIIIGKVYDNIKMKYQNSHSGLLILVGIPILTALILPFAFSYNTSLIMIAMLFWGLVMGSHEVIMKAGIADITPINKRATGYGIFNVIYGLAMFIGSLLAGYLYDISISLMILVLICIEVLPIPLFFILKREIV